MTWARIDDSFDGHPKVRKLSLAARGLFASALAHSARFLSDGFLDDEWMRVTGKARERKRALAELETAGMLYRVNGGWCIHDYLDFNPSRAAVEAKRAREASKKRGRRATSKLWTGEPLSPPDSPEHLRARGAGRDTKEDNHLNGDQPEFHARLPETVAAVLAELDTTDHWTVDPVTTRMAVENAITNYPDRDPHEATRIAVGWTLEPGYECRAPGVAFAAAMRKVKPRSFGRSKAERERDDIAALRRLAGEAG